MMNSTLRYKLLTHSSPLINLKSNMVNGYFTCQIADFKIGKIILIQVSCFFGTKIDLKYEKMLELALLLFSYLK